DNHLTRIADLWLDTTARQGTAAITASTNEHVDAINAAIQAARINAGQLDPTRAATIGGDDDVYVGDVVATRRNNRHLHTTTGEPVRNRELWTVTGVGADGSLTVSSHLASGTVTLPVEYVSEHVRLGYAATEHGNQSDTVTIGVELATTATSRRGLYVGVTRGEQANLILVVTDGHALDQARDILEGALASDRVDIPATTQRRLLAATDRAPHRHQPTLQPRCEIPAWFEPLRTRVRNDLTKAQADVAADARQIAELKANLVEATRWLAEANQACEPYRPALSAAHQTVESAREQWWAANNRERQATKGRHRRAAHRDVEHTKQTLDDALIEQQQVEQIAKPATTRRDQAAATLRSLETTITPTQQLIAISGHDGRARWLRDLDEALDDWHQWATGRTVSPARLAQARSILEDRRTPESPAWEALANLLPAPPTSRTVQRPIGRSHTPERDVGISIA
ncbi:MAG: hypothetical protein ABI862_14465, partial [Ilumatobacteraceae bacterium]